MKREKRDLIRREKRRWQKMRFAWKKAHPIEAAEKAQADLMDSARRAVEREDRILARELKIDIKQAAYFKRQAERAEVRKLKGAAKPRAIVKPSIFRQIRNAMTAAVNRMTRMHRPASGTRIAGAK
jgi:hypothetical protein